MLKPTRSRTHSPVPPRRKAAHLWNLDPGEHYCEPHWCSERLFEAEPFAGSVLDPCAGFGRIPEAARAAGFTTYAGDIVDRGCAGGLGFRGDFLVFTVPATNVVFNPPFTKIREFVDHALTLATCKVAAIVPTRRLNAMGQWLAVTPLYRVWMLTPRPSMPPGSYIAAGHKVGGGTADFCWCVWLQGFNGKPTIEWLHRDKIGLDRISINPDAQPGAPRREERT